ncbi:MAG TPA: hypothetical protein VG734_13020 [Lacunisphaera sp.]|nr:hypothetical protein [Lacunisphaera sp.]
MNCAPPPALETTARDVPALPPAFWRLIRIGEESGLIAPDGAPGKPRAGQAVARMREAVARTLAEFGYSATEFYLLVTLFRAAPRPVSVEKLARETLTDAEGLGIALDRLHAERALAPGCAEDPEAPVTLTPSGRRLVLLLMYRTFRSGFPGGSLPDFARNLPGKSPRHASFMKKFIPFSRILLGLMFLFFGLNGFLHFIALPPHAGVAGQFMGALVVSRYALAVFALQALAGGLLLANRFVLLALAILAPILVNIALFHVFMAPHGAGAAMVGTALWSVLAYHERARFAPLWSSRGLGA